MPASQHFIPHLNGNVFLHPRTQLRRFKACRGYAPTAVAPSSYDWTKNHSLLFPMLGNDQYGDCEYAAGCHASQTWTGNVGTEDSFDTAAVVKAYLKLSGGDNGLNTDVMMAEFKRGLVGGPHKILDYMSVNPRDQHAMQSAIYNFGSVLFTLGIPDLWLVNPVPGGVWDAGPGVIANEMNGHAVLFNLYNSSGYELQTWGFKTGITITLAGVMVCQPEATVMFSLDWFNSQGVAPNGQTYDQLASLWVKSGGRPLPANPFVVTPPHPASQVPPLVEFALAYSGWHESSPSKSTDPFSIAPN